MARSYLPPGFRFHPTDEELTLHYLKKKVAGKPVQEGVIGEVDIYKFEPCELPGLAILCSRDSEWFFFTAQDKKARTNRTTRAGYWKATGKDRKVHVGTSTIGWKKTLVYYLGRAPSRQRTDWIMHEYRLDEEYEKRMNCARSFVLCRVRRKGGPGPRNGEQYGAPVLDPNDELEAELSSDSGYKCIEAEVPSERVEIIHQGMGPNMQLGRNKRDSMTEDLDSRLLSCMGAEPQEHHFNSEEPFSVDDLLDMLVNQEEEPFSVDDLLDMLVNQEEVTDMGPTRMEPLNDMDPSGLDPFHNLPYPVMSEAAILEDLLQQVDTTGDLGASGPPIRAHFSTNDAQSSGFLEVADLEEPLDGQASDQHLEELLRELDCGMEGRMATEMEQHDERSPLSSLHTLFDHDVRNTQQSKSLIMERSSQVPPIIISNELGRVGQTHTRLLLASDDGRGDLPSGSGLGSDQEGSLSFTPVPGDLSPVYLDEVSGGLSKVDGKDSPDVQNEGPPISEEAINERGKSLGERTMAPTPTLLASVLSGFLGKVNVLPASAAELPMKQEIFKILPLEGLNSYEAKIKLVQTDMGSLRSRKFSPVSFSVFSPEMEKFTGRTHGKGLASGLSIFLFWIAASALILLCFFRECCKSTRSAFTVVL